MGNLLLGFYTIYYVFFRVFFVVLGAVVGAIGQKPLLDCYNWPLASYSPLLAPAQTPPKLDPAIHRRGQREGQVGGVKDRGGGFLRCMR